MNLPTPILIAAINARHSHASMGARCLLANMGEWRGQTELLEFTIQQTATEIAAAIVARQPRILGLGVYIWNVTRASELLPLLRHQLPDMKIILGGPELSAPDTTDTHAPPPCPSHPDHSVHPAKKNGQDSADYLVLGEGELAFATLCHGILSSPDACPSAPSRGYLPAPPPDLSSLHLPYDEYTDADLAHRILYVESSRGCAMRCDYCVSANDTTVRFFPMPPLLAAFDRLLARGARQFKFCDRSFNLNVPRAIGILSFFLDRLQHHPGLFLHFEMLPDRFPDDLRDILARFPPRSLQLEIGIQSFTPQVLDTIRRPQHPGRTTDNLRDRKRHV